MITVPLGDRTYDIFFAEDVYPLFQEWICRFYPGGSVFVITDRNVASIYGEDIRRWLVGIPHHVHAIEPGEESKNADTVRGIYAFLAQGNADRDALVVAFGGGVVGDLAGFAAATFLRGIPYVQIPTTLLAQVDSSVGGKTGFNLPEGKNLVGAFHQPRVVFIDHGFLRTLDDRNLRAGMAEVVKCGLAGDEVLWETLCSHGGGWKSMSGRDWHEVIRRSVAFKASIVGKDERESSLRRVLNLGHTIGHAPNSLAGRFTGGDRDGPCLEAVFSRRLGITPRELEERLVSLLKEMGFALDVPGLALTSIAAAAGMDKKRVVSDVDMPMVSAPGACSLKRVPLALLRKELPAIRAEIQRRGREAVLDSAEERELQERIDRGSLEEATGLLVRRLGSNPRDLRAMVLLSDAYHRAGKLTAAWEMVKEALQQYPADARAQRLAREIEEELHRSPSRKGDAPPEPLEDVLLLPEGSFEIRPADPSPAARRVPLVAESVRRRLRCTVTMADVCGNRGRRRRRAGSSTRSRCATRGSRALEWKKIHEKGAAVSALAAFLGAIAKEFGYDLSGHH
jgi:3-dehydroquinate synthase